VRSTSSRVSVAGRTGHPELVSGTPGVSSRVNRTLLVDEDAQAHATFWFAEDPDDVDYDLG